MRFAADYSETLEVFGPFKILIGHFIFASDLRWFKMFIVTR
jgi:hypothetical protein